MKPKPHAGRGNASGKQQKKMNTTETGEHRDYVDAHNNHRITVVRMDDGFVGLRFSPLPPREGYPYAPMVERTEAVRIYPAPAALPTYAEAHRVWIASKRD